MKKNYIFPIFYLFTTIMLAQDNLFLQRDFWKGDPSVEEVEKAIADGNDITELNRYMFDGVSYAFLEKVNNSTMVHIMGKKGNEVDKMTHDGRTYIFWAAYKGNLEMMQWLVDRGAKANIEDSHGYSVLNFAAIAGQTNPKLYDFLLEHDADINATNNGGANALLLISPFTKDFGILDYFTDKGLSFDSTDEAGNGIFQYASKGGNIAMLKSLIEKGADFKKVSDNGENALFMAARGTRGAQNGMDVYSYLEGLGLANDLVNKDGENLLHLISRRNKDMELYQHLIGAGLDINLQDKEGHTPFMYASGSNSLKMVEFLSGYVEDFDVKDTKGRSALAWAVSRNKMEVVKYLLEKGADVNTKDEKGNTLAYYVLETYNPKSPEAFETKLKVLRTAGIGMDELQHDGNTVLHLAAKENNLPLLKRLEEFGLDLNKKNDEGNTALHLAAMSTANTEILKYLIDRGADVTLKTDFEETVYDLAKENELLQLEENQLDFLKL
ncbi:MAG: ankyrin repeat domain-containing protein [Cyanobacteria bacterium P01_A01_bin.68]